MEISNKIMLSEKDCYVMPAVQYRPTRARGVGCVSPGCCDDLFAPVKLHGLRGVLTTFSEPNTVRKKIARESFSKI
jgi:hypothetical protein